MNAKPETELNSSVFIQKRCNVNGASKYICKQVEALELQYGIKKTVLWYTVIAESLILLPLTARIQTNEVSILFARCF